ncbi:matrixin [Halorientalis pallida]|uniref:Matrixin n=1 Tax=Halorientalis pallida TaxID=2479928 RepID=A0A498KZ18_9EURY|nr:matrixin [Halorientalis pallida]RXK47283.1 matrixin [Halorientalis pallida]
MRSAVAVVAVLGVAVLAGCSLPNETLGADTKSWSETEFVVAVDPGPRDSDAAYAADTRAAIDFWEDNAQQYLGHPVEFTLRPNASDPDVVVRAVAEVTDCGTEEHAAGCAPLADDLREQPTPVTVRVRRGFDRESTRQVIKHEFGHILGQGHDDPPADVMMATSTLATTPRPNATDRPVPWSDPELAVYVDAGNVSADDRTQVREQVDHALDYYADGAAGTVPDNVTFRRVDDRAAADVVVTFPDRLPCEGIDRSRGSCRQLTGIDPDGDGTSERYTRAEVYLTGLAPDAVGWHVGRWLGDAFGAADVTDLAPPFRDASYEQRRSAWWR